MVYFKDEGKTRFISELRSICENYDSFGVVIKKNCRRERNGAVLVEFVSCGRVYKREGSRSCSIKFK
jgi:hypothetical protein